MSGFKPKYLVLHDYGGTPGANPGFNPYHALVSGGKLSYRYPDNPYGQKAPHAFQLNPEAIGLSWGGQVGGTPSAAEMALLKAEYDNIMRQFPGIRVLSHGEAFAERTKGLPRASKLGRGLDEASWRKYLRDGVAFPGDLASEPALVSGPTLVSEGQSPLAGRSITAGHPAAARPSVAMNSGSAGVNPTGAAGVAGPIHSPSLSPAPAAPAPAAAPSRPSTPVGPSGPSWAEVMQNQMLGGTPALQGSLSTPVNKSSPQYKNALIGMLGGIF